MTKNNPKQEIVTFKVDSSLLEVLKDLPNRSEFIRRSILGALDNVCPLCQGSGVLSPNQKKHWDKFSADHELTECDSCHEIHLICAHPGSGAE
ncbi:MAG: CopG family transcriptional regulator [Candidatus Glassbacteria bacterium]|nr:CopG family transcriptional regulator [Candidatus Glassbacteria bacterium]